MPELTIVWHPRRYSITRAQLEISSSMMMTVMKQSAGRDSQPLSQRKAARQLGCQEERNQKPANKAAPLPEMKLRVCAVVMSSCQPPDSHAAASHCFFSAPTHRRVPAGDKLIKN